MKKFTKIALVVASFVLVVALSVGATIAWLTAKTEVVTNTFAPTGIEIEIKEHKWQVVENETLPDENDVWGELTSGEVTENTYDMIPGVVLPKDPFIRVKEESEPCYIYMEIVETNNPIVAENEKAIGYAVKAPNASATPATPGWTQLYVDGVAVTGKDGGYVYYYSEILDDNQKTEGIFANDQVSVNGNVTDKTAQAVIKFNGYAVQAATFADAIEAWKIAQPATVTP